MTVSTIPVQISEAASQHIAQLGLQEPFQRMLDEVPKRIPTAQGINVSLEHIVDENWRPVVIIAVERDYPGRDDPTRREFDDWVIATFPTQVWEHLIIDVTYTEPHAG